MDKLPLNHNGKEAQTDKDLKSAKFTFAANVILCLIICGLALAAMEYFNLKLNRQHAQAQTTEQLAEIRADLEFIINKNLALAQGVTSYISLNPDIDQASFSAYVDHLLHSENNIRNIGAAKDLTISLIHPLAGNEQALGLNYRENKDQAEAALKAIETDQIVLAGPLELVQGGVGLIGRQAVYQQSNNHLWGIISFVLDYPSIMESAIDNRDLDLNIAIRGKDSKGYKGQVFEGDAALFERTPVMLNVNLPYGNWVLAAEPKSGWPSFQPTPRLWFVTLILLGAWIHIIYGRLKNQLAHDRSLVNSLATAEQFKDIFENHDAVMLLIDSLSGRIIDANVSAQEFYGYSHKQLTTMKIQSINQLAPEEVDKARLKAAEKQLNYFVFPQRLASGEIRTVEVHSSPIETNGKFLLFSVIHDITDRIESEKKLSLDAAVFEHSLEGIIITNRDRGIISVNRAFTEITGYTEAEVLGKNPSILSAKKHQPDFFTKVWEAIEKDGHWKGEVWNRRKNGKVFPELLSINTVAGDDGQPEYYVGVFSDITQLKKSEEELENLAHHDSLTGLPNRFSLRATLDHAIRHARRNHERIAVLFLDLDKFKVVNDSLGHAAGDELLKAVSERLNGRLREQDTLGRLGGDEFVIILENLKSERDIIRVAKEVIELLSMPFSLSVGQEAYIGTSIGIAQFPDNANSGENLIAYADVAMYQAKQNGRNTYSFYNESLTADADQQLRTFSQIKKGIREQEFELYYQPQIDISNGKLVAAEALLRWNHPERGVLTPAAFVKIAEDRGIIRDLSKYVLAAACDRLLKWKAMGLKLPTLSVNISGQDFNHREFCNEVQTIVEQSGIDPSRLELEITENTLMRKADTIQKQLRQLRDLGINLAIDDFGTGYSSLSYLKHFPINKLKIDRSFVKDIDKDPADRVIISAIIDLAENFNLTVVAEGVEQQSQQDYLEREGCHLVQGYLHSKPLPSAEFEQLLQREFPAS